jgi:hypoxanthine phosphoribosyltransferase
VSLQRDVDYPIRGRHVLLVEDVINTGLTLDYVMGVLSERGPASLEVVTLLDRPSRRIAAVQPRYTGFQVGSEYVVGYGLGYRELYRNLPFICTLKPSVYARDTAAPDAELKLAAAP